MERRLSCAACCLPQAKKELPEWSFSVSNLDALKISKEEAERRKASMVSKHAEEAKEELERRLMVSSRNPRASLKALEALAPEEDPCVAREGVLLPHIRPHTLTCTHTRRIGTANERD